MIEKLSKQPRQPQCHVLLQELWMCGRDCWLSSKSVLLPECRILAAPGNLEGKPLSPAFWENRCRHTTKSRSVESGNIQDLPPPGPPQAWALKAANLVKAIHSGVTRVWDFPSDAVDKNLPAHSGDRDLIPGPEHSTCHRATKPMDHRYWLQAPEPMCHNYQSLCT